MLHVDNQAKVGQEVGTKVTSAMVNTHLKVRQRSRERVREQTPKVAIADPLAARRRKFSCCRNRSVCEGGTTLTSVPVSMRKHIYEV